MVSFEANQAQRRADRRLRVGVARHLRLALSSLSDGRVFLRRAKVGCVGDSITAGSHSTGGDYSNMTYPAQMQRFFDSASPGGYEVTNLGASGATMLRKSDDTYWKRDQYNQFVNGTWDVVVIMLGTNDAKDVGDHHGHHVGPDNWHHDCGKALAEKGSLEGCSYASDYAHFLSLAAKQGPGGGAPKIFVAVPPPLMKASFDGMNQTVINTLYPVLIPLIAKASPVPLSGPPINVFECLGGVPGWKSLFPGDGCAVDTGQRWPPCANFCDEQSCNQVHPNDVGYSALARCIMKAIA